MGIPASLLTEPCDLSPQQMRTWLLSEVSASAYVSQCTIAVEGGVDVDRLRSAIVRLARRHEMLRIRLSRPDATLAPRQAVASADDLPIECIDASGHADGRVDVP